MASNRHPSFRHSHSVAVADPLPSPVPKLSAQAPWFSSLQSSPQLRRDLRAAGVDVERLAAYATAATSRPATLKQLQSFLDPKPRGGGGGAGGGGGGAYQQQQQQYQQQPASTTRTRASSATVSRSSRSVGSSGSGGSGSGFGPSYPVHAGWDPNSAPLDWSLLNGSRDLSIGVSETACAHPDTEAGRLASERLADLNLGQHRAALQAQGLGGLDPRRMTDRRSGHRVDYALPSAQRFVKDAYYARIEDARKAQEGKAPHLRLPEPVLWNGECREQQPKDEQQRRVVEDHMRRKQARTDNLLAHTRHSWAPTAHDPAALDALEWTGAQSKKQSIQSCPAAGQNTYDRLFHTDLPIDSRGLRGAPRSSAALAREQHLRDRVSHGRDYDVVSSLRTAVIPPSQQAQLQLKLSGPNAIGRFRMDQQHAEQQSQQPHDT